MHILFVSASIGGGGAERVVAELASEMAEQGHRVQIVVIGSLRNDYSLHDRIRVINCTQRGRLPGLGFLARVRRLRQIVKQENPDVCIAFNTTVNIYAALACGSMKRRLILAERNDPISYPSSRLFRSLRDILYTDAFSYAFQTSKAKAFFSKNIQNNGTVIFNPINRELPAPHTGVRTRRIVMAGRLEPQKNLKMAMDAFALLKDRYPDYVLEIYGEGSEKELLQAYAQTLGLSERIKLMGRSNRLYQDILDGAVFVLSSDFEGMSNSMLEAMALGIPTISTDYPSGGARAVIRDGENGLLVPVGDTEALSQAICRVLEDPSLAQRLSQGGVEIRKTLSVKEITGQWLDFAAECARK